MVLRERTYTSEEFLAYARLPQNAQRRLELVEGVIVEMPPSKPLNSIIVQRVGHFLNTHILLDNLGYVSGADGGFVLAEGRVRQPDMAFISKNRYATVPDEFQGGPDIAVEIVSSNEDVLKKVTEYLEAGTRIVWAVYPVEKIVHVFTPEQEWRKLGINDSLTGGDVLPDFSLAIKDIFPPEK